MGGTKEQIVEAPGVGSIMSGSIIGGGLPLNPSIAAGSIAKLGQGKLDERVIRAREALGREMRGKSSLVENLIKSYESQDFNPIGFGRSRQEFYADRLLASLTNMKNEQGALAEKLEKQAGELLLLVSGRTRIHTTNIQGFSDLVYMKTLEKRLEARGVQSMTLLSSAPPSIRSTILDLTISVFGFRVSMPPPIIKDEDGGEITGWSGLGNRSILALPPPSPESVRSEIVEKVRSIQADRLSKFGVTRNEPLTSRLRDSSTVLLSSLPYVAETSKSYDEFLKTYELLVLSRIPGVLISDMLDLTRTSRSYLGEMLQDCSFRHTLRESFYNEAQRERKTMPKGHAENHLVGADTQKIPGFFDIIPFNLVLNGKGNYLDGPLYLTADGKVGASVYSADDLLRERVEYLFPESGLAVSLLDLLLSPVYCTPPWSYLPATYYTSVRLFENLEYGQKLMPRVAMPRSGIRTLSMKRNRQPGPRVTNGLSILLEGPGPSEIELSMQNMVQGQLAVVTPSRLYQNRQMNIGGDAKAEIRCEKRKKAEEKLELEAIRSTLRKIRLGPEDVEPYRSGKLVRMVRDSVGNGAESTQQDEEICGIVPQIVNTAVVSELDSELPRRRLLPVEVDALLGAMRGLVKDNMKSWD